MRQKGKNSGKNRGREIEWKRHRETFYSNDQLCACFVRKNKLVQTLDSKLNKSSRDVFGLTWIGLQVL